jgi:nitrogen regulatory protein PII
VRLIKCIIRPEKVEAVRTALAQLDIHGLIVGEVRGHGREKAHAAMYRGQEYAVSLLPKLLIEAVVDDDRVDAAVDAIVQAARTGESGDGRVYVLPIEAGYNIRTGERY